MPHRTPEDQGSIQRWIFFILIAGLVAITVLYMISRVFEYSGPSFFKSPYSADTTNRLITISSLDFWVPQNVIRSAEQRNRQTVKQLDMLFLWPTMEGFSRERQVAFSDASEQSNLIFVSMSRPKEILQSSDRLYGIYSQFFTGNPIKGPATLIGFAMDPASGFRGETIYFKPESARPFVARCIAPENQEPSFCMREVALGSTIQVSYRFRPHLLAEWATLDQKVLGKLNGYLAP
nr:hypothetical protein [uncultured Cohaesibacter sp.]